ncbi:hypothetical protein [Rhizobium sp. SYY.PMSO]|uniref:hypothetical protein n=1 Tax=Rhizobium sp. SYY.PMSO TaxID=3382192 RepID=UPI00398FFDD0
MSTDNCLHGYLLAISDGTAGICMIGATDLTSASAFAASLLSGKLIAVCPNDTGSEDM